MSIPVSGLHHVTAVASDPQRNIDFYVDLLGLRLVKRTINFDDPGTYHFYYGDSRGTPGTILTFFPWPNARRGGRGTGEVAATAFTIAADSIDYWLGRLKANRVTAERASHRFGEEVIRFADPDGMIVELIESAPHPENSALGRSTVPADHSLRGFHSVSAALEGYERTAKLLTDVFGYRVVQEGGETVSLRVAQRTGPGRTIDLVCKPDSQRGRGGAGSVHHIAFRTPDDASQLECRRQLVDLFKVRENGMPRFFRRLAEGVFDEEDLVRRTHELADFVGQAAATYGFDPEKVVAVGYSNGANIAGSTLLLRPGVLYGAALLRPMVPLVPETLPDLKAVPVLVAAGNQDPIVPAENARELVALLRQAGADVTVCFENGGHSLTDMTVMSTQRWLAEKLT